MPTIVLHTLGLSTKNRCQNIKKAVSANSCNLLHILERFVYLHGNYNLVCIKRARDMTQDNTTSISKIKKKIHH